MNNIADEIYKAYEEGYADGKKDSTRHGWWDYDAEYDMFACAICDREVDRDDYEYCPWCGTKMDMTRINLNK